MDQRIKRWEGITGEDFTQFKRQTLQWMDKLDHNLYLFGVKEFSSLEDYFEYIFSLNIGSQKVKEIKKVTARLSKDADPYLQYYKYKLRYTKELENLQAPTGWLSSLFSNYKKEKEELERLISEYSSDMDTIKKNRAYLWDRAAIEVESILNKEEG